MALIIRKAIDSDKQEIAQMYIDRVNYNDAHNIHQWNLSDVTWEEFDKLYTIDDYYVCLVDGKIAGGMFLVDVDTLYWPNEAKGSALYLHKICVHPQFSKQNVSDALIEYFKALAKQLGYPCARLDVRAHKTKLRQMYERHDFVFVMKEQVVPEFETALYHYVF